MKATNLEKLRSKHKTPMTCYVIQMHKKTFILHIFCATKLYVFTNSHA